MLQELEELESKIRKEPANVRHREGYFKSLALMGQWDRAVTQLDVLGDIDSERLPIWLVYRSALNCEIKRVDVFAGKERASVLGDPESWMASLQESLRLICLSEFEAAQILRDPAFQEAPPSPGKIQTSRSSDTFQWIADADSRFGPVLEAIVNGSYYWIPFHRIRLIEIDEPSDLSDLIWLPASLTLSNGTETKALIPTRYPGTTGQDDSELRLARKTEWVDKGHGVQLGLGQRLITSDKDDFPIMDIRRVEIFPSSPEERMGSVT